MQRTRTRTRSAALSLLLAAGLVLGSGALGGRSARPCSGPLATAVAKAVVAHAAEIGARAYGMGGAYAALASDLSALYYNPAGLGLTNFELGASAVGLDPSEAKSLQETVNRIRSVVEDVAASRGSLHTNLSTLAGLSIGGSGVGFFADAEVEMEKPSPELGRAQGRYITSLQLGAGRTLLQLPGQWGSVLLGSGIRFYYGRDASYSTAAAGSDQSFVATIEELEARGYAVDLGLLARLGSSLNLGLSVRNATAELAWSGERKTRTYDLQDGKPVAAGDWSQPVPIDPGPDTAHPELWQPQVRLGAAAHLRSLNLALASDWEWPANVVRIGAEQTFFFNALAMRIGRIIPLPAAAGGGRAAGGQGQELPRSTLGLGVNLGPFQANAAVGGTSLAGGDVTLMADVRVRF